MTRLQWLLFLALLACILAIGVTMILEQWTPMAFLFGLAATIYAAFIWSATR